MSENTNLGTPPSITVSGNTITLNPGAYASPAFGVHRWMIYPFILRAGQSITYKYTSSASKTFTPDTDTLIVCIAGWGETGASAYATNAYTYKKFFYLDTKDSSTNRGNMVAITSYDGILTIS